MKTFIFILASKLKLLHLNSLLHHDVYTRVFFIASMTLNSHAMLMNLILLEPSSTMDGNKNPRLGRNKILYF